MAFIAVHDPEWPTSLREEMVLNGEIPAAAARGALEYPCRYLCAYPWTKPASCMSGVGRGWQLREAGSGSGPNTIEFGVQMLPWATGLEVFVMGSPGEVGAGGVAESRQQVEFLVTGAPALLMTFDMAEGGEDDESLDGNWRSGVIRDIGEGLATDQGQSFVIVTNLSSERSFYLQAIQFRQTRTAVLQQ